VGLGAFRNLDLGVALHLLLDGGLEFTQAGTYAPNHDVDREEPDTGVQVVV